MIVCYDNTVNRQKLADVDCSLDTVSIPKGSERDIGGWLNWNGQIDTWSQRDPLLIVCVKAQPQICFRFMFLKPCSFPAVD